MQSIHQLLVVLARQVNDSIVSIQRVVIVVINNHVGVCRVAGAAEHHRGHAHFCRQRVAAIQAQDAAQQTDDAGSQAANQRPQQRIQRIRRTGTVVRHRGTGVIGEVRPEAASTILSFAVLKSVMVTPACEVLD